MEASVNRAEYTIKEKIQIPEVNIEQSNLARKDSTELASTRGRREHSADQRKTFSPLITLE